MEKNSKSRAEIFPEKSAFKSLDFFVIRTPLLPVSHYYSLSEQLCAAPDIEKLIKSDGQIERALVVGNPGFYAAIKKTIDKEHHGQKSSKDSEKVLGKLLRILTRMSTRPTPFGLYAGVALGKWEENSTLSIAEVGAHSRTRLDMELVTKLALGLEKKLLPKLQLISNPTLRQFSTRLYLLEKAPVLEEQDIDGSWLEATEEVMEIVALTQSPISYSSLLSTVTEKFNMYEEDTHRLIEYMVENTYLLTSLRPNTFNTMAGETLLEIADDSGEDQVQLREVLQAVMAINKRAISPDVYFEVTEKAKNVSKVQTASSLQTDMKLSLDGTALKKTLAVDLERYIDLLIRIAPMHAHSSPLRTYKEKFFARYELREVPILELLNQDYGLGFPEYRSDWSFDMDEYSRQILLDELVYEAVRDRKLEVQICPETLSNLLAKSNDFNYPISADLFVNVLANSLNDIDEGNYLLVNGGAVAGAGRNLGRFADMVGDEAITALKTVVDLETALVGKKEILAELSSMPRTFRLGNVCTVPIVRPYHIVLDSWPGKADDQTGDEKIALNDLLIGLENSKFYLRSIKHGARVRINSPSLVNPLFKTQISRFLTAVTEDAQAFGGRMRWGTASDASFRPRLRFEKFVLSPAQWSIRLSAAKHEEFSDNKRFKEWLARWRERWFVPRYVQLREHDNLLLLDLENDLQAEELRRELCSQKNSVLNLQESFCGPDNLWISGPEGKYVSELVASFVLATSPRSLLEKESTVQHADPNKIPDWQRIRCPGHEWIYVKLYCGKSLHDDLLVFDISTFVEALKQEELIKSWFFIKYEDPEPHLRVRFYGDPAVLEEQVHKRVLDFSNALVDSGACTKFQLDAYNREIERYGGVEAITFAEEFFCADSELIAKLLHLETLEDWSMDRQLVASLVVDKLLDSLGIDSEARIKWYKKYATGRNEIGEEFRKHKEQLHFLFSTAYGEFGVAEDKPQLRELFNQIDTWSSRLQRVGRQYHDAAMKASLSGTVADICSSFVHMHCNRYLGIDHQAEWKARALACRAHEARSNRKHDTQSELLENSAVPQA